MMDNQFLDGKRYISGIWRILDSWGYAHSIISGKGPLGWFYAYAALRPEDMDYTFTLNYLDGIETEGETEKVINRVIDSLFVNPSELYKTDLNIDSPPELRKQHFYEVRSADPDRIRNMLKLAVSIPLL